MFRCPPKRGNFRLGLISYSVYLRHYPVFAFARIRSGEPVLVEKLGWIALTVGLSVASYRLVERPCRRPTVVGRGAFLALCGLGVGGLGVFAVLVVGSGGFPGRVPDFLAARDASAPIWEARSKDGESCYGRLRSFCSDDPGGDAVAVHVYSDSHLSALSTTVAFAAEFAPLRQWMGPSPSTFGARKPDPRAPDCCRVSGFRIGTC